MVLRAWAEDIRAPIGDVRNALGRVRSDPTALGDRDWVALLGAAGAELDELSALADLARCEVTDPGTLTFVANRNLDTAAVAGPDAGLPGLEELVVEASNLGATEICMQGPLPAAAPADGYLRAVERIATAAPELHLHAFRPAEIRDGASRLGIGVGEFLRRARAAGLGSVPGTAAQVLDDEVRGALAGGQAPPLEEWTDTITAAHHAGLFSTATMLYGHVETPAHQVAHLRRLNRMQEQTGGFSELILMPMLPENAPPPVRGIAVAGPSDRETRAVHAVARLMTRGHFDHLQVAWTKMDRGLVELVLAGGADDIGGLLLDGQLRPEAGAEAGRVLTTADVADIAARVGRRPRQRTTRYGQPEPNRVLSIPQARR